MSNNRISDIREDNNMVTPRVLLGNNTSDAHPAFRVGDVVYVRNGATGWMKERGFWLKEWPETIDGMRFVVVANYTHLGGDSAHWWLENERVKDCGVHPQFLLPNGAHDQRGERS